jgi:hypothetical protein
LKIQWCPCTKKFVITKKKNSIFFKIFDISENKCIYFSVEAAKVIGVYRTNPTSYKIGYQGGPNIINSGEVVHRPLSHKGASSGW